MPEPMSADEARAEIETWLTFHAENRPGDSDRMGVSYERAPLHRSALRALLDQNARLLAESEQSTAAPAYIWSYNDDEGENCSEPYATEGGARAAAEKGYVDNVYIDARNAGALTWSPLPQNPDMLVLRENGQAVGIHLWRSKVIGGGPTTPALPVVWTDPTHGTVYDLTKPHRGGDEDDFWHHVGWIDLDTRVPLMGWSGSPDGRTASRNWEDISTLATLIADFGPLTPVEPTQEDRS